MDWNNEPYYITLKLEPAEGDFLRQQYEDIVPGYYMDKTHWNSIKPDGVVPDDLLKDLLEKSYRLVLGGFSKKKQREILEAAQVANVLSCCGTDCSKCGCFGNMCGECEHVPCETWRKIKDSAFTEEEFERNMQERVDRLKKE